MTLKNCTWRCGLAVIILCLFSSGIYLWAQSSHSPEGSCSPVADDLAIGSDIENAVLAADWSSVARACGSEDVSELPLVRPVRRILCGLADLSLNRSNDALVAFASADDPNSLSAWSRWTETFVQRHPTNGVVQFLRGDAVARLGQFDSAIQYYDEALRLKPGLTLALVAKGVALASAGRCKEAYDDLKATCDAKPPLADAYTSLGTLIIRSGLQPEDANECYEKALSLSPDSVLALNGLGCVKYAVGEWEKAPTYFVQAGKKLPLPLFLGNLRALMVAVENFNLRGQDNSPLFRFSDFYDWDVLREKTAAPDDVFRTFLGSRLPTEPNERTLAALNETLEARGFYAKIRDRLDMTQASQALKDSIEGTRLVRATDAGPVSADDKGKVILLNRLVLEHAYPYLIARHDQRDPGMQLTLTHGLMDQMDYKRSLTPTQITQGQWNMDHLGHIQA